MVKPQFECAKKEADIGRGIIRDPLIHKRVLNEIKYFADQNLLNSQLIAEEEAIPKGTDGNTEFFLAWKKRK